MYTTTGTDGVNREYYVVEIARMSSDNLYHTLLYNPLTGSNEDFKAAVPNTAPTRKEAWSLFETHYVGTTPSTTVYCQPEPAVFSEDIALATDPAGPYSLINYQNYTYTDGKDCTKNDATYGAYYTITAQPQYWRVDSMNSF